MENPIMRNFDSNNNDNNNNNDDNNNPSRISGGKGRRKVEMKKIENKTSLIVTFSKRRTGLFKKTKDITEICKKTAAVITFSPVGKPYAVGYPSVDSVVEKYLRKRGGGEEEEEDVKEGFWWERSIEGMNKEEFKKFNDALIAFGGNLEGRLEDLRGRDEQAKNFLGVL